MANQTSRGGSRDNLRELAAALIVVYLLLGITWLLALRGFTPGSAISAGLACLGSVWIVTRRRRGSIGLNVLSPTILASAFTLMMVSGSHVARHRDVSICLVLGGYAIATALMLGSWFCRVNDSGQ